MGKTALLLVRMTMDFGWVRLHPYKWECEYTFATFSVIYWSIVRYDCLLTNGNENRRLQHFQPCTGVYLGETPTPLMGMRNDVCIIRSHEQEFG